MKLSPPQQKVIDFLKANPDNYIVHDPEYYYGQMCRGLIMIRTCFFFTRSTFDALLKRKLIKDTGYLNRYILNNNTNENN